MAAGAGNNLLIEGLAADHGSFAPNLNAALSGIFEQCREKLRLSGRTVDRQRGFVANTEIKPRGF